MTTKTRLSRSYLNDMRRRAILAEAALLCLPAFATPLARMFYAMRPVASLDDDQPINL